MNKKTAEFYLRKVIEAPDVFGCIDLDEIAETAVYLSGDERREVKALVWEVAQILREEAENAIEKAIKSGRITLDS